MAELDSSNHTLNLSTSKQKYSFPKTKRFQSNDKSLYLSSPFSCDELYSIPTTFSKRATMLGYGHKTMGIDSNGVVPGVGAYSFPNEIDPEKNMKRSISFGVSREVRNGLTLEHGARRSAWECQEVPRQIPSAGDLRGQRYEGPKSAFPSFSPARPLLRKIREGTRQITQNPGPGTYNHE